MKYYKNNNLQPKALGFCIYDDFFRLRKQHARKSTERFVTTYNNKRDSNYYTDKDKVVSISYEEIGLFPRSFSRVLDRFLKQLFSDVDNLVIQEYRFYRYLFLTTIKTIFILFFVPFVVNFAAKNYVVKPITEYFWNTSHPEIFLNSYEQKRAFAELEKFEEKIYFDALVDGFAIAPLGAESYSGHLKAPVLRATQESTGSKSIDNIQLDNSVLSLSDGREGVGATGGGLINPNLQSHLTVRGTATNGLIKNGGYSPSPAPARSAGAGSYAVKDAPVRAHMPPNGGHGRYLPSDDPGMASMEKTSYTSPTLIRRNKDGFAIAPRGADISKVYQEKTIELATSYNNHSIEAITNFFADLLSLCTLLYLLITLEIQINITKSFLLEVFFGLDDSKKSLLILLVTDLLVGYHSSNLWELFFEFIFNHYGIPESKTGIFLLVATLPVLLDVLFKYLIFRHLNRSSPATVATYQAIIE